MRPHPLIVQLAEERRALDLTQSALAKLAGLDRKTVTSAEAGTNAPHLGTLDELARALGYRIELVHMGEKACRGCGDVKPIRDFRRDRRRPDGLARYCGPCSLKPQPAVVTQEPGLAIKRANLTKAGRVRGLQSARSKQIAARDERLARYTALRESGMSRRDAAKQLELKPWTARRYDELRAERAAQQEVAA